MLRLGRFRARAVRGRGVALPDVGGVPVSERDLAAVWALLETRDARTGLPRWGLAARRFEEIWDGDTTNIDTGNALN